MADVVSAADFCGTDADVKHMAIVIEYSDTAIEKATITYKTDYSSVELVYVFEK